jgi:hypothetical protein
MLVYGVEMRMREEKVNLETWSVVCACREKNILAKKCSLVKITKSIMHFGIWIFACSLPSNPNPIYPKPTFFSHLSSPFFS